MRKHLIFCFFGELNFCRNPTDSKLENNYCNMLTDCFGLLADNHHNVRMCLFKMYFFTYFFHMRILSHEYLITKTLERAQI